MQAFTPAALDVLSRRDGLRLRDLRGRIPAECFELYPLRSWVALVRTGALLAVLQFLLTRVPLSIPLLPVLLLLWFAAACCLVGLFVLGHDCGHRSFSPRRWVNDAVGHLCMAPLFTGFHAWRVAHNHHHAHTQLRREDPDWPEKTVTALEFQRLPALGRLRTLMGFGGPAALVAGFWTGALRRVLLSSSYPQIPLGRKERMQVALSNAAMIAVTGAVVVGLWGSGGAAALAKHYLAPVGMGAALGSLLTLLHHSREDAPVFDAEDWSPFRGQVLSTFQVRFPALLEWLWLDINIHLPHHLAPRIPWYHLRAAGAALRAGYPEYYQERRFRWRDLRLLWARPLLRRDEEHRFYLPAPR